MEVTNDIHDKKRSNGFFSWIRKEENEVITTMRIYGSRLFFFADKQRRLQFTATFSKYIYADVKIA